MTPMGITLDIRHHHRHHHQPEEVGAVVAVVLRHIHHQQGDLHPLERVEGAVAHHQQITRHRSTTRRHEALQEEVAVKFIWASRLAA